MHVTLYKTREWERKELAKGEFPFSFSRHARGYGEARQNTALPAGCNPLGAKATGEAVEEVRPAGAAQGVPSRPPRLPTAGAEAHRCTAVHPEASQRHGTTTSTARVEPQNSPASATACI